MRNSKKHIRNVLILRRKVKERLLNENLPLFREARIAKVIGWRNYPSAVEFIDKARKQIGYSQTTWGYDILRSFEGVFEKLNKRGNGA